MRKMTDPPFGFSIPEMLSKLEPSDALEESQSIIRILQRLKPPEIKFLVKAFSVVGIDGLDYCDRCAVPFIMGTTEAKFHIYDCRPRDASDRADRNDVRRRNYDIVRAIVSEFENVKKIGHAPRKRYIAERLTRVELHEHEKIYYMNDPAAKSWLTHRLNAADSPDKRMQFVELCTREGSSPERCKEVKDAVGKMFDYILPWKSQAASTGLRRRARLRQKV
jgi:hypothetical protein